MKIRSLRARLLSATFLAILLFTLVTAVAVERAFRLSMEAGISEQLQLQIFNLLSVTELKENRIELPFTLKDDRLNDPKSGFFAFAFTETRLLWKSGSARWSNEMEAFFTLGAIDNETSDSGTWTIDATPFFYRRYQVTFQTDPNTPLSVQFVIMQTQSQFLSQLNDFRQSLWISLGVLGLGLLATWLLVLGWGLQPLRRLAVELLRIEIGKQTRLEHEYPDEFIPVSRNLNRVLEAESVQRERYKQTMADLAHSLKTPLAVLKSTDKMSDMHEQVERMDQIIGYQLNRAIISRTTGYVGPEVDLKAQAKRLASAIGRVYPQVTFEWAFPKYPINLRMDEKDLMEVLGNLIENACKYGRTRVRISADRYAFSVCDNGDGISPRDYERVLQRGIRLDNLDRGQGIGLAVVSDIVHSYDFELKIATSDLGGACFRIIMRS